MDTISISALQQTVPTFDLENPAIVLDWAEPTYSPILRDEIVDTIKLMLNGDFPMPVAVQNALFNAAGDRERRITEEQVSALYADFANKGFGIPPGMLWGAVSKAREEGALRLSGLNREIYTKSAEWSIENLRQAVTHGIQMEAQALQAFLAHAERVFEAAKFRAEAEVRVYDSVANALNARYAGINAIIAVFNANVQAELAKLQKYEVEVKAATEWNAQEVEIYKARVSTISEEVKAFAALIDAVRAEADMEVSKMEAFKEDVQAYVARIQADKTRFDAYEAKARVEASKASVIEAAARGFAATVEAQTLRANTRVGVIQARARALEAAARKFEAEVSGEREVVSSSLASIQAQAQTIMTKLQGWEQASRAQTAFLSAEAQVAIEQGRVSLMKSEVASKQFDGAALRILEQAKIQSEAAQAAASAATQLAAGAMSAIHVQAGISGSASAQGSESHIHSYNHGDV